MELPQLSVTLSPPSHGLKNSTKEGLYMYSTLRLKHETKEQINYLHNQINYLKRQEDQLKRHFKMHKHHERQINDRLSDYELSKQQLQAKLQFFKS